ncbi:MAG: NAD-dependent epimerase/dehydratase family protein, partial [Gemmatimonadetes bacterium]|nr:NAD-dependent epimerase/dehydratase family protein [Gemmatimonadota bacterium]
MSEGRPLKVHVTGAYGLIGNLTYRHLSGKDDYEVYGSGRRTVSSDRIDDEDLLRIPDDRFSLADLTDRDAVSRALSGMDAVVHLGAVPDPGASFETILECNIRGTYNVLEVCREEGIKRLIYASSVMASWGYGQFSEPYVSLNEGRLEGLPDPMP